jgi:hypothetical protein
MRPRRQKEPTDALRARNRKSFKLLRQHRTVRDWQLHRRAADVEAEDRTEKLSSTLSTNPPLSGRVISDVALTTRLNAARTAIGDTGQDQRLRVSAHRVNSPERTRWRGG